MKQKLLIIFVFLFIGISSKVQAYSFSAFYNGKTIYYNITSYTSPYKVEVTSYQSSYPYYPFAYTYPTGIISIPYSVTNDGKTYLVTSIGNNAFRDCPGITSVTIPNSVISIGSGAFYGCNGLTSVTIPNSVTSIGNGAFSSCNGLTSVTLSNSVALIGDTTFKFCPSLSSMTIPNSVTSIGNSAFRGCSGMILVTIGDSVTSIGSSAFLHCDGLTSVTIPNSVTSIGNDAFSSCTGLTSVTIPNSVTSIGGSAFSSCTGLTSITIPNSVTSIGAGAFYGCNGLTTVSVDAGNIKYSSVNGVLFNKNADTLICYPNGKNGSYSIPNSVSSISSSAFNGCKGLTSVIIPNSVTSIGDYAFKNCSGLTSITIPNLVTSIGNGVFSSCTGLKSITIPNSVTLINHFAFDNCTCLTSVTIGTSVSSIGYAAFKDCKKLTSVTFPSSVDSIGGSIFHGCTNLSSIICKSINPPIISSNALNFSQSNLSIYVPCSSKVSYMSAPYWNSGVNYIGISDSSKYISASICKGQFYTQYGFNVDSAGVYIRKIQGINGCDSLVVLNISEYPSYSKIIKDTICKGQIYSQNGFYADSTGQYIIHHQTINGCDSIITLKLVVSQKNDTINASICKGQIYSQNGFYADSTGQYIIHHQTINGCDSIITLNLVVNKKYNDTINASICQGQVYNQFGFIADSTGIYTKSLQTKYTGCDSIVTLNLVVNKKYNDTINASICQGHVYTQNGFNTSIAGIYKRNMHTINGCDSIIILNLTVNLPTAPSNFAVTKKHNHFELTWQGSDSCFMIYRNDSLLSIVSNNIYLDSNLVDGKIYCYKMKAKNGLCESNFSNLVCRDYSGLYEFSHPMQEIQIYPNPATNMTILSLKGFTSNSEIIISDLYGRIIRTYNLNANQSIFEIDLKGFSKGVYNISIVNKSFNGFKKLIVN